MIDFDPKTQIALMLQDVAMKFMIWAGYYNGLELLARNSFSRFTRNGRPLFAKADAERLDRLQDVLFKCFDYVEEPCPYSEESLNSLFGSPMK